MYICACACTYIHTHTGKHILTSTYAYRHTQIHIGTHSYTRRYTHIQINTHKYIHIYTHRCMWCIHIQRYVHTQVHTPIHRCIHTYIHTQVHMHTLFLCVCTHSCMCVHVKTIGQPWVFPSIALFSSWFLRQRLSFSWKLIDQPRLAIQWASSWQSLELPNLHRPRLHLSSLWLS